MDRFTERRLLRGLTAGFALVLLLLGVAGALAVEGARAIEDNTAKVAREQLVSAQLLNDAQAGQSMLAAVLHQLTRLPGDAEEDQLVKDLETADAQLDRVAKSASATSESGRWSALLESERIFSRGVRQAVRGDVLDTATLRNLFEQHETVVRLEQDLLQASEKRLAKAEQQLDAESRQLASRAVLLLGACFALSLLCAALTVVFARKSIRSIEWHANELGRVSWHMLQSQVEAARRFSHELHDELGQSLAAVRANLMSTGAHDWSNRREDCLNLVDGAIANVRELSQLLRPVILDDFGLDAGLRWLSERFAERTGIRVDYVSSFKGRLPDEIETHLYRIAQEAFTNIARHSGATEARVELDSKDDLVSLTVEDNGRGIGVGDTLHSPSLGMTGMRARARQAGGRFRTSKPVGGGLRIEIQVPKEMPREVHAI
jgi:signal transduction histidine kinase